MKTTPLFLCFMSMIPMIMQGSENHLMPATCISLYKVCIDSRLRLLDVIASRENMSALIDDWRVIDSQYNPSQARVSLQTDLAGDLHAKFTWHDGNNETWPVFPSDLSPDEYARLKDLVAHKK